jgi:serine/threonine protein kinase
MSSMAVTMTRDEFLKNLRDSGLFSPQEMGSALNALQETRADDGVRIAEELVAAGELTPFQAAAVRERQFGELVIGNYQVLDRLGAGGMGTVYKARHRRMKRVVAIKVLSRTVSQSETSVQRFQREVEAVARLSHPNIVMAYDADEAEVGHFLVMEFVNGRDLASAVSERGPLPIAEAVECIVQAARAMAYAHGQGIVHRDIKPANLLRDVTGVVKVADLGLARFNDTLGQPVAEVSALTQAGTIMGTVDFMPPEQALGLPNIDHRADIYSLGCTLYFLLAGRPPYQGATLMATLLQHREAPIPPLSAPWAGVPAALDQIFRRMVAKKPEERFASMDEVVKALEALALGPESLSQRSVPAAAVHASSHTVDFVPGELPATSPPARDQTIDLAPVTTADTSSTTILLVEPSRSQAVIIRGYLQKLGHADVPTMPSGEKALESARATAPNVVISAMHLSDMTGVQLAQKMWAEKSLASVGFILITSQADAQEANLLSSAGHVVALHKPFTMEQLAQALSSATAGPDPSNQTGAGRAGNLRVLLVDDSAAARVHIRRVLTGLGLRQITEAVDGAEAVTLLERERFDLVVTDYTMPRLDGRGLVEFIRQRSATPAMPVIMVTTETDPAKLNAVRQLGVSAICDKSFNPEVVRAVVERLG